jgi:hypothetical protein
MLIDTGFLQSEWHERQGFPLSDVFRFVAFRVVLCMIEGEIKAITCNSLMG